jgi:hypothetical protein
MRSARQVCDRDRTPRIAAAPNMPHEVLHVDVYRRLRMVD